MSVFTADNLQAEINESGAREHECRPYLEPVLAHLHLGSHDFDEPYIEERLRTGNCDYLVTATTSEAGVIKKVAYVWELKAPQCTILMKDDAGRGMPSEALRKAESELLHFFEAVKYDEIYRNSLGVGLSENVRFGGIVIGCERTLAPGCGKDDRARKLVYEKSIAVRQRYLYKQENIRIVTWDEVVKWLRGQEQSATGQTLYGEATATSALTFGPSGSVTGPTTVDFGHK